MAELDALILGRLHELPFESGSDAAGYYVTFTIPRLEFWNLVILAP